MATNIMNRISMQPMKSCVMEWKGLPLKLWLVIGAKAKLCFTNLKKRTKFCHQKIKSWGYITPCKKFIIFTTFDNAYDMGCSCFLIHEGFFLKKRDRLLICLKYQFFSSLVGCAPRVLFLFVYLLQGATLICPPPMFWNIGHSLTLYIYIYI